MVNLGNPLAEYMRIKISKNFLDFVIGKIYLAYFFANGLTVNGFSDFMPEFLSDFSTTKVYTIMLVQTIFSLPGGVIFSYLTQTSLGRRYTGFFGFFMSCVLFSPFNSLKPHGL